MGFIGTFNYWMAIIIMMIGFYGVIAKRNLIKQVIALGLFQTGVFLFYVTMGVYRGEDGTPGTAPIWQAIGDGFTKDPGPYDNPLPHVLMLTAIVVSVSTLAVAVAIIVNIKRAYGTIEEDEILDADRREGSPAGAHEGQVNEMPSGVWSAATSAMAMTIGEVNDYEPHEGGPEDRKSVV